MGFDNTTFEQRHDAMMKKMDDMMAAHKRNFKEMRVEIAELKQNARRVEQQLATTQQQLATTQQQLLRVDQELQGMKYRDAITLLYVKMRKRVERDGKTGLITLKDIAEHQMSRVGVEEAIIERWHSVKECRDMTIHIIERQQDAIHRVLDTEGVPEHVKEKLLLYIRGSDGVKVDAEEQDEEEGRAKRSKKSKRRT